MRCERKGTESQPLIGKTIAVNERKRTIIERKRASPAPLRLHEIHHRHQRCRQTPFDVLVVGGGINGAGIARDLAGRGFRVLLTEQHDLAAHTSSSSTKLIHGGLRYLEYYEFGLVRKALQEREVLLKSAPHIIWPMRFVMPHDAAMRPAWMIRAGLFLYDHLARREVLPGSTTVDLRQHPAGAALQARIPHGLRLLGRLGRRCPPRRAERPRRPRRAAPQILTRTRCEQWCVRARGLDRHPAAAQWARRAPCVARALVNAAGPWAESFLRQHTQAAAGETLATKSLRLVKGSHIVVPRCFEHEHAYILQNADKRIIFADSLRARLHAHRHDRCRGAAMHRARRTIEPAEIAYLCEQASRYLGRR